MVKKGLRRGKYHHLFKWMGFNQYTTGNPTGFGCLSALKERKTLSCGNIIGNINISPNLIGM